MCDIKAEFVSDEELEAKLDRLVDLVNELFPCDPVTIVAYDKQTDHHSFVSNVENGFVVQHLQHAADYIGSLPGYEPDEDLDDEPPADDEKPRYLN